ncbi:hypothetical protein [Flavobacterium lindanitolerans]|jgi:hypothetical protein|uniref:hypothetical protein n=1 Tax=Flavobacterium lindanitolerans TaxID=428988 RepID=UPI0023F0A674|nr:hypothetical protein [Flavobacterium lindanitolerans]
MKTNKEIEVPAIHPADCPPLSKNCSDDPLMRYLKTLSYSGRADWLKEYGDAICKYDLYSCIENSHAICSTKFEDMAREHGDNRTTGIVFYSLSWKDLEDFIKNQNLHCYSGYIAFDLEGGIAKPRRADYTQDESVYSVPLFEGIKKVHGNINTIYFTRAIVPFKEKQGIVIREGVIFKVEDAFGKHFYYDISDDPAKKDK